MKLNDLKVDIDALSVGHQLGCTVLSAVAGLTATLVSRKAYVSVLKMVQARKAA